jgi:7,8-dihydropterin-6-yl-methyl-4-(beta-D-ribofuranosyl)aminobenzene 5'-phosphate synthase
VRNNGQENKKYVGMQFERDELEKQGMHFTLDTVCKEVAKDIYLTGEVPRITDYEKGDVRLLVERGGAVFPDPLLDDQSLVIKTNQGLLIVLGCAHAGVINTVRHITGHFRHDKIHTIVGGTHLGFLTDDQQDKTIADLKNFHFKQLGASHCTGSKASARLFHEFGDRFFFAHAGTDMQL